MSQEHGAEPAPTPPVRPSRARRTARRRRLRGAGVTLVVILLLVAIAWWTLGRATTPEAAGPLSPGAGTVAGTRPLLLSLDVIDGSAPYLAVMGTDASGSRPAAIPIPHDLTLVVPGSGETPAADVARLPGPSLQVALSNELGVWTPSYAVMTVAQLGSVATRMGGLRVDLPEAVNTPQGQIGPGSVTLSGPQLQAVMREKGGDPDARWDAVLTALMATPPTLERSQVKEVNSLPAVQRTLTASLAGEVLPILVQTVGGTTYIPKQPDFDHLVQSTWRTRAPVSTIVQNGNGTADVAESVARSIIPAGFRVVLSQNAQAFDVPTTSVIANGTAHADQARRAQKALGLGQVQLSPLASGVADVTIVVGKDFTA